MRCYCYCCRQIRYRKNLCHFDTILISNMKNYLYHRLQNKINNDELTCPCHNIANVSQSPKNSNLYLLSQVDPLNGARQSKNPFKGHHSIITKLIGSQSDNFIHPLIVTQFAPCDIEVLQFRFGMTGLVPPQTL